jgi:DNA-binding CsgD family transcriptional regulator
MTPLTPREADVMVRVSFGMSNEDIGTDLSISPHTVRTHVSNALLKLRARTRAHAVGIVMRTGGFERFYGASDGS